MEPVSPIMLLRDLSRDRSNWTDVRHYPDTVTLRRMIRLADFAAQNPTRWQAIRLKHECPGMTQTEIARVLRISQSAVSEYLKPVDLARPDDYPEDDEL